MMDRQIFSGPMFLGDDLEFVEEGYVVVVDGRIADCGEGRENEGKRRSVIPAFINAHTHVGDYFLREKCVGMTLGEACGKGGVKENCMSAAPDDVVLQGMMSAIHEMVRTGTCCFSDFREGGIPGVNLLKKALSNLKCKGIHARIFGRPLYIGEEFVDECDGYGVRSIRAEKIEMMPGKPVGMHVCEAKAGELEKALEFRPDFLVHMNSADKDEIKKASSINLPIVTCPRSNAYFGLKRADIVSMLDEGILLCLGTDNAMVSSLSMISEMEYALRTWMKKVSAKDILKMATANPAKVFGWDSGYIEKGRDANFILADESFLKTHDPYATAILRLQAQRFEVMLGGNQNG